MYIAKTTTGVDILDKGMASAHARNTIRSEKVRDTAVSHLARRKNSKNRWKVGGGDIMGISVEKPFWVVG